MTIKHAYAADILKAERNADGDLVVYGKATGPDLDLDKQICDPAWLKSAMPAWMQWGNVREQHSSVAAGVATDLEQDGDSWMVRSLVVDPGSARKVETGVLKGYSIGIKNPRVIKDAAAPGGRIVGGEIVEVSLVDRPCNPTCTLVVGKSATPGMEINAGDFDEATNLVRVEELHETPDGGDTTKAVTADPAPAPDTATQQGQEGEQGAAEKTAATDTTAPTADDTTTPMPPAPEAAPASPAPPEAAEALTADGIGDLTAAVAKALQDAISSGALISATAPQRPDPAPAEQLRAALKATQGSDPATAKRHVLQRATALGRDDVLPDTWKGTDPDTVKSDGPWVHDPAQLAAVRDGLITLMKAELDEFAAGDDERCDLHQLLRTLSLYLDWWDHEARMGETSAPFGGDATGSMAGQTAYIDLAATGDDTTPAPAPSLSEDRINELIAEAMTKATAASKERITALEAELAKVNATPIPGGPVLTRTAADTNRAADQDALLAKAANFRRLAEQVPDQTAKTGYWQLAQEAEQAAERTS